MITTMTAVLRGVALTVALATAVGATAVSASFAMDLSSPVMAADAWIMRAPPALKMHAGYLALHNHGEAPHALVAVTSPSYGSVEMHLSREVDGVATMQHVSQVEVPAGGVVTFQPGGLHLMLMAPQASVAEASEVVLHLTFDDGSEAEVVAKLREHAPQAGGMDHSSHGGMDAGS